METTPAPVTRPLRRFAFVFGAWTLAGFVSASLEYFTGIAVSRPTPYWLTASWNLVALYLFAATFPAVTYVARRFPFRREQWLGRAVLYIGWIVLLSAVHLIAFFAIYWLVGGPRLARLAPAESAWAFFQVLFLGNLRMNLAIYGLLLFCAMATNYYRRYLAGEKHAALLREQLAQAQLQALKMQLHPHFLFNTLNAISELVHKEPETAETMIIQLSEMLRLSLDSTGAQQIPLEQELAFLEKYLAIEQTRFRDRLKISIDVEPEALRACVPNMLLQPLVENAVRHGIAPLSRGGSIDIRGRAADGKLHLEIRDDGRGLNGAGTNGKTRQGVGLANTRARLEQLYGAGGFTFALDSTPDAGVTVRLAIPLRHHGDENDSSADR